MNRFLEQIIFLVVASLFGATSLRAASTDRYWLSGTDDFNVGTNWSIDVPPNLNGTAPLASGDTAYIDNGGTAMRITIQKRQAGHS